MTTPDKSAWIRIIRSVARSTTVFTTLALAGLSAAQAANVTLKVVSARNEPARPANATCTPSGTQICRGTTVVANYKFLVNIDNTGQTTQRSPAPGTGCSPQDAGYPNSCLWTSIAGAKSNSRVYTQGTQANVATALATMPNGRYLISVLADGYKLDGRHFTVNGSTVTWEGKPAGDAAGLVTVEMQPFPLPDAQIQAAVFEDVSPVNSGADLPAEHGLAGFQGHIVDVLGEVTTNVYGHPLCSRYDASGALIAGSGGRCMSKCYVVNGGVDVGLVRPIGWSNPLTPPTTNGYGRCPTLVLDPDTGVITPPMPMYGLDGVRVGNTNVPDAAAIEGKVKIPNLGPNRYTLTVTPSDGSGFVQTTTLEGNHDWDAWPMEGATGLDTEFLIAGEPFPAIIFGFTPAPGTPSAIGSALKVDGSGKLLSLGGSGSITGIVEGVKIYVPTTGGVGGLPGEIWGGLQGAKIDKPIPNAWVTLTSLDSGDTIVWVGQADANGKFTIPNVPAGNYTLTWWDEPQNTILDLVNVTVGTGENIDMGILPLAGWWTFYEGYVFNDTNRNGVKDAGEPGLSGYTLTLRRRDNSLMDRGSTLVTTDPNGYYKFEAAYPMTQFLVMEAYDNLHYTTGITYQADNQNTPTTKLGAGVDVSVHPIIGLGGTMDWGKHIYDATGATGGVDPQNGGIVGTVSYDTTRNETDPRYAAVEDWQPSISDLVVKLYKPVAATLPCVRQPAANATCDSTGRYALAGDGSLAKGQLLNTYLSETWKRPNGCVARGLDGTPYVHGTDEQVLPLDDNKECIEAPLMGVQFWGGGDPATNEFPGVEVDGNYGFGDGCFGTGGFNETTGACADGNDPTSLLAGDYLVQVDLTSQKDTLGNNVYKVTREEDINIGNGDEFVPAVPPSACAGALHTVDSSGNGTFPGGPGTSPYEGQARPLCDVKLVTVSNGKSIAPSFNLFTDVPIPGRHWFIIIDDLNFSSNPKSATFGEKAGMPFVPVGIYDYTNRLIKTVESDYNGLADVLLPSTNRINCPTPSGVCAGMYRYVGNDPGVPGRLNPNFNPTFRTIAAEFEVLPGQIIPADLAPTQVGVTVQLPGVQTNSPVMCMLDAAQPELYAVDQPYATRPSGNSTVAITIKGKGFGATKGSGRVNLDNVVLATSSWTDTQIVATLTSSSTVAYGPHQLGITANNGQSTVNGLTFHVMGGSGNSAYNPQLYRVGPGLTGTRTYQPAETLPATANHAIQNALDAADTYVNGASNRTALVVVYPNNPTYDNPRQNPRGAYYENLIVASKVKLQGVGPGSPDGSVRGSIIDGSAFGGDSVVSTDWYTKISGPTFATTDANGNVTPSWAGNATIYDGAVISLYLRSSGNRAFPSSYSALTVPSIDGFDLRGGDQQGFPGNINAIGGGATGLPGGLITQGGAIFANAYARNLQITNNVVQNNGGAYGTIRIGTPDLTPASSNNQSVVIANNRVITNAGTNQAGGIGIFAGADNYQVVKNDICGNFSSEYGGGVSHVGLSPGGSINNNRIYFNRSFDEGGGVMIAGALPANPTVLSTGAGSVSIFNNLIQGNLSNDDGGGIRFLMAGNFPMNVYNNFIVNNISTHEGGGVSLNDTPNVRFYNNTVMKNMTTATALTSNGAAAPAGLSTSLNSTQLQATLPGGSPVFSNPLLFNNIFWDNRAGTRAASSVIGIGNNPLDLSVCTGLPACDHWDLGVADGTGSLAPTNSIVQQAAATHAYTMSPTNSAADPAVVTTYDVGVTFNTWRNNPAFLGAILISADLPPNLMGDYHLGAATSPAINLGAASKSGVNAPAFDIDNQTRPQGTGREAGADEFVAAATAQAIVAPAPVAFGSHATGTTTSQTLTLSNAGNAALTSVSITVTGTGFSRNGGTCGTTVNANASCTIIVSFAPTAAATYSGSVAITASASVANAPVSLSGTGTATPGTVSFTSESGPADLLLPNVPALTTLAFGNQNGNVSDTVTLTIGGGTAVTFATATVSNGNPAAFSKGTDTCSGTTRQPGATCTITVNFNAPSTALSLRTGTLSVPHNGAASPTNLILTGR